MLHPYCRGYGGVIGEKSAEWGTATYALHFHFAPWLDDSSETSQTGATAKK